MLSEQALIFHLKQNNPKLSSPLRLENLPCCSLCQYWTRRLLPGRLLTSVSWVVVCSVLYFWRCGLLTSERMLNWSTHACSCTSSSLSLTIFRFPDDCQNRKLTVSMVNHIPRIFGFLSLGCSLGCKKASEAIQEYQAIEKEWKRA